MGYTFNIGSFNCSRWYCKHDWNVMPWLDIISALWPVAVGFAALIFWLAKSYADIEMLKDKVRVLYELHNDKDNN